MKLRVEMTKEELEEMLKEKLSMSGFGLADEDSIQWKTKPTLHVVIEAVPVAKPATTAGSKALPVHAPTKPTTRKVDPNLLPAGMDQTMVDELTDDALADAADPKKRLMPGESFADPREDAPDDE
jgi:hypothetical protein